MCTARGTLCVTAYSNKLYIPQLFHYFFYCFFSIKQVGTHAQWAHLTAAFVANYKHNFTYFSHFFQRETLECCCCCCCWGCTAATSEASTVHSLASCRCDWASPRQDRSEQVSVASSSPSQSQSASALRRQRLRLRISSLQFDLALWFSACWIRRVFNSLCVWVNITDVHTHTHTDAHHRIHLNNWNYKQTQRNQKEKQTIKIAEMRLRRRTIIIIESASWSVLILSVC